MERGRDRPQLCWLQNDQGHADLVAASDRILMVGTCGTDIGVPCCPGPWILPPPALLIPPRWRRGPERKKSLSRPVICTQGTDTGYTSPLQKDWKGPSSFAVGPSTAVCVDTATPLPR